ncbi:MANSC domain-containing protein 1 [Onychostruthus taczanowskii]|uniref:MANSC domain-containing protein 1 n=1 Tax=Onychostruthus taczanowskii TaxID=356909 RepID=UPI001B7FFEE2|nr:MANSC domain-containing protein 1 [Onychostruthus taczanowskii]
MSRGGSRWPVRLLVITCVMAGPALSQECSAEKMENSIIDIDLSLPRGVRGAEPLRVPSAGACVRACCSGHRLAGDKKCNLIIFYAARTSTHPNCYLFYCPSTEACPMKPATGLVSYKITTDIHALEDKSIKTENFSSNEYPLPSDAGTFISHSQDIHQNHTASLEQSVFHQASELLNHIGKHLDNMELHTVSPESQRAGESESLDPISGQQVINVPPRKPSAAPVGNPTSSFPTTPRAGIPETSSASLAPLPTGTAQMESPTTSLHPAAAKPTTAASPPAAATAAQPAVPATSIAVTHVPLSKPTNSASPSITVQVTTNSGSATALSGLRTPAMANEPTVVSSNDTSHVTLHSFPGFILSSDSPSSSQNDLRGYDPSDSESSLSEGVLRGKGVFQLGEKSSLIAALFFGVIFLLVVIVLTGKKIHESLQKRHYTKLDYLINGMYADV